MEKKISVVIPNYNGSHLLSTNLPHIQAACQGCEIVIVDDKSEDNSVNLIEKKFKSIKLIKNKKNKGFAKSANIGAKNCTGDLVLLLNSDVRPKNNFLQPALRHFKSSKITNLFAVGLCDLSHENDKIVSRGKGGAKFTKGFVNHFAKKPISGETLWVSGGSGLFDKKKFLELAGFDSVFKPFYWEDIDLSFRAWRKGFKCIFEAKSQVDHFHEKGAIQKRYSVFFIKAVSYKNQYLFVWKNIDDYFLILQHILWQPYHFLKALIALDFAFFAGLIWAVGQIPQLIFDYRSIELFNYKLSPKEVIEKFEKP